MRKIRGHSDTWSKAWHVTATLHYTPDVWIRAGTRGWQPLFHSDFPMIILNDDGWGELNWLFYVVFELAHHVHDAREIMRMFSGAIQLCFIFYAQLHFSNHHATACWAAEYGLQQGAVRAVSWRIVLCCDCQGRGKLFLVFLLFLLFLFPLIMLISSAAAV